MEGGPTGQVLIIGAGLSGLKLGSTLAKSGKKVIVVDSNDYIGGRIKSFEMGGTRVEEGASSITPKDKKAKYPNPLAELVDELKLQGRVEKDDSFMVRDGTGDKKNMSFFKSIYSLENALKKSEKKLAHLTAATDISLREALT